MRNICRIIRSDFKRLFSNSMSVIIAVGLVVMPSIFAWYNVMACWNVFDNTGNLTVAVANTDDGYKSDLIPLRVNIGEQVVSALRANKDIDWTFTTEEDAVDGARSGRYYAAVVIPPSFSKDMLTFYSDDVQHGRIVYYANEKKSAIAPKITDKGADSVAYQVNETFTQTVSEVALGMAESLARYADDAGLNTTVADLSDHIRRLGARVDQTASVLDLYASLTSASQSFIGDTAALIDSTRNEVGSVSGTAQQGAQSASSLVGMLKQSVNDLSAALDANEQGFQNVETALDNVFGTAQANAADTAAHMREHAADIDALATKYRDIASQLEEARDNAPEALKPSFDSVISQMNAIVRLTEGARNDLNVAADKLDAGASDVQAEYEGAKQQVSDARQGIANLKSDYETNLKPGLDRLAEDAATLASMLNSGMGKLDEAAGDLSSSAGSASELLGGTSEKINTAAGELREVGSEFATLADDIDTAMETGDTELLRSVLSGDVQSLAHALAAPVGVERTAVFPVENFGSAMAPLYTTLALFIGALLIMVVVKPYMSARKQEAAGLVNAKPRQLFLGRFGVVAFLSLCQTTVMGLGNMFFLGVQVVHPLLFMVCFWAAGLVFAFIIYALVVSFANLGKAIAVLMLIIQVTGCGGSFPLQILPDFVQRLSPWLPATHVVNAMRAAMFGVYGNDFWVSIGYLALFILPAALLGLVLRKPLAGFMHWYVEKVESTKLIG